jgi:hypothetical protein
LLFLFLFFEILFRNGVFSESVAVALDIDHFTVMKQPVQYGGGNDRSPNNSCQSPKLLLEVIMMEFRSVYSTLQVCLNG